MFFLALGLIWMTFGALETGLEFNDFQCFSGVPRAEGPLPGGGNLVAPCAPLHQPNSMEELYNIRMQHQTCRNKGIRKNQDANSASTKNQGGNLISFKQRNKDTG